MSETRYCGRCKKFISVANYSMRKTYHGTLGYAGWCKPCSREYAKAYKMKKKLERESDI